MKIVFWGTPTYAVKSLDEIINSGHKVIAAVTQPDKRRGRGSKVSFSPVKKRCIELSIPVFTPQNIRKDFEITSEILNLEADAYIVVAFGQILPNNILQRPKYGCWNSHASLLPRWRGAAPIQWSLLDGDQETGVGIMYMEEGLDTGPLLIEQKVSISNNENATELEARLSLLSANLLTNTLDILESTNYLNKKDFLTKLNLIDQKEKDLLPKYARMLCKEDYRIDWNNNSTMIYRKIRGLYPKVYCYFRNKRLNIISADQFNTVDEVLPKNNTVNTIQTVPGTVLYLSADLGILLSTLTGLILVKSAKLEGKQITSKSVLINQLDIKVGDVLN